MLSLLERDTSSLQTTPPHSTATRRYSLLSRSKRSTVKRKRANTSTGAHKDLQRLPYTKTLPSTSSTPPAATRFLIQPPKKWTVDHLRAINIQQEIDLPIERIVAPEYVPSHNNPGKCAQARFLVLQQLVQI